MDNAASIGRFVSDDGHASEPQDLWVTRMDWRFTERAPRIEKRADHDYFVAGGIPGFAMKDLLGSFGNEKAEGRQIIDRSHNRAAEMRLGADDPKARLADQDLDNLRAEVCYPNHGLGRDYSLANWRTITRPNSMAANTEISVKRSAW
jgi:hypothetical protein